MQQVGKSRLSRGKSALGVLCASAAMLAVPATVLALNGSPESNSLVSFKGFETFTPASVDPRLAELFAQRSSGGATRAMRFTPASDLNRENRSVTVAVRVDERTAKAISVRAPIASSGSVSGTAPKVLGSSGIQITPTRYDLGVARGYRSFAGIAKSATPKSASLPKTAQSVDLKEFDFKLDDKGAKKPSRFNARIELDKDKRAGSAPGTLAAEGNQSVDVGGSFSVTKNLDVTAGVRYSQERDPIQKLPEGVQDQQSVYVGTQFRF